MLYIPTTYIGIIVLLLGIGYTTSNNKFYKKAQTTTATIKQIVKESSGSGKKKSSYYLPYVDYTVNGKEYHHVKLDGHTDEMRVGDNITVHYDPDVPTDVRYKSGTNELTIVIFIMAIILFSISLTIVFKFKGKGELKKKGVLYVADNYRVVDVSHLVVRSTSKGGYRSDRAPTPAYKLVCDVFVRETGQVETYESAGTFQPLNEYEFSKIDVYVDPKNPKNAFVDLQEAINNATRIEQPEVWIIK